MKRVCIFLVSLVMLCGLMIIPTAPIVISAPSEVELIQSTEPPMTEAPIELPSFGNYIENHYYEKLESKEDILQRIEDQDYYIHRLYTEIYFILVDGGVDSFEAASLIEEEVARIESITEVYQADYDAIIDAEKWAQRWIEYPIATEVWLFMRNELGWSNAVAAGVMGNMMHECGGCTMNLNWVPTPGDDSVGICQWKVCYEDRAWLVHSNLQDQLNFLKNTVKIQIDNWGWKHKEGFNYNAFCNLTSCEEAAEAFATCYERCSYSEKRYETRRNLAQVALQYFTS